MSYSEEKDRVRDLAIDWQNEFASRPHSYGDLLEASDRFEKLGRRFGLLREFRESGIL